MWTSNKPLLKGSKQQSPSHEVRGCGNSLPGNRRPRSSCGLHREVRAAHGKGFCWGLPLHVACEVPELKIIVSPNPTLHQEQLTALLETWLHSSFMDLLDGTQWSLLPSLVISKRTLSPFLSIQKNSYLHIQVWYTWNTCRESVKYTTSSKTSSRWTLF